MAETERYTSDAYTLLPSDVLSSDYVTMSYLYPGVSEDYLQVSANRLNRRTFLARNDYTLMMFHYKLTQTTIKTVYKMTYNDNIFHDEDVVFCLK